MAGSRTRSQSTLVHSLATLLRNDGDSVLAGNSTLTLQASSLQHLTSLFEQYLLSRTQQHGFLALPSHPADTDSLLQLQFLFDVLQKTVSLKLINPLGTRLQSVVKIFPFKSLRHLELKRVPPHCLEGLRGVYSQLEVFTCSKSVSSLEELLSLCGGDLSSALPWLELHTLNFSYNSIVCLDESLSLLNVLKYLDLSHNKIQECEEFLKPLSELEHLNLGYNCLQRTPVLGFTSRARLLTLILRNNELETINGVEQLCSLQHLDLAYNLLMEHSQLAPLSLLHCLSTLTLDGNPLFFQRGHRTCTVRHLSPKAAFLRLKLDGMTLTSSELSVLPIPGQLIGQTQVQALPTVVVAAERGSQEVSSGGGELSDSVSVGEVGVTRLRKKKAKSKVKVRRASISEPSDTDYVPRRQSDGQDTELPHQKDIERMDSFREKLGEDWLRYQHHLEGAPPTLVTSATSTFPDYPVKPGPQVQKLTNGLSASPFPPTNPPLRQSSPLLEVLPPPLLSSEPREEALEADTELETDSTLLWSGQSNRHTESTLDSSLAEERGQGSSTMEGGSADAREEEEEEELGVDLCPPLLVGVLCEDEEGEEAGQRKGSSPVFLRVKQDVLLEVDMQRGQERARLELDCLGKVTTSEVPWTEGEAEKLLPSLELHFRYISRERRRRRYVMLDDHPQEALQALSDVLLRVAEANERRVSEGRLGLVRLQCLRCGAEFCQGRENEEGGRAGRGRGGLCMGARHLTGEEEDEEEEQGLGGAGSATICPECSSDHVVQLAGQSAPSTSTPIQLGEGAAKPQFVFDHNDTPQREYRGNKELVSDEASSARASPLLEPPSTTNTTSSMEDPSAPFVSAQGSSFFGGEGEGETLVERSPSEPVSFYSTEDQSREELAGSYNYTSTPPPGSQTPTEDQNQNADRPSPGHLDLLSEDYETVDHRLKLFLDVEVFEEEEELHSFLKMSTVKFGELEEFPSLLVVSDQRIYFLEMTSHMQGQPTDWLQKRESHPITELSYLEVGLGSQSIHMEFEEGGVAYTLLIRDSGRCKRFFNLLTGVVREMASKSNSKLKSISTTRLTAQHHLWSLVCEDMQTDVEDGQLQFFYLLAYLHQGDHVSPLTLLATRETLYLLNEDHQWSKSLPNPLTSENGDPCSGRVTVQETQPISCVSSVVLWSADPCRVDIQLYDEVLKQEKTWRLNSESPEQIQGLLVWVRTQWETMFGVKLTTSVH